MAQTKTKKQTLSAGYKGFGGIDARIPHGIGLSEALNFRLLPDGSLRKRQGFRCICSCDHDVRSIWSGVVGGEFRCYFLAGNAIRRLDLQSGESSLCATVSTSAGRATFFYLRDALYLIDGRSIYRIGQNSAEEVLGYVPLLGKDWGTGYPGEINEPLNILHRHARITYKIGETHSAYLPTLYPVREVIALYKNGDLLDPSLYYFDQNFNTINIAGLESGDYLEADLTFDGEDDAQRDALLSSTLAYVFGGINNSRLFAFGGESENVVFTSTYVSRESLQNAEAHFAGCGHIYFRTGNQFTVGDGRYSIKGVTRHYDRLLIMTEGDTWMADSAACGEEEFPVMNVNSKTGCCSEGGVISVGNDPVSIGRGSIYRWTSQTDELNEANAYSISEQINSLLPSSFFKNAIAYSDSRNGELWFTEPDSNGVAWIYNLASKAWTKFNNVYASAFFDADGEVGFVSNDKICVFDDACYYDYEAVGASSGRPIMATLRSGTIDFGSTSAKRLLALTCSADLDGSSLRTSIITDRGEEVRLDMIHSGEHFPYTQRLHSHRFNSVILTLTLPSIGRQTIHSLELEAR